MNPQTNRRQQRHLLHKPVARNLPAIAPAPAPPPPSAPAPPTSTSHIYTPVQLAIHEQFRAVGIEISKLLKRAELRLMLEGLREGRDEPTPTPTHTNPHPK